MIGTSRWGLFRSICRSGLAGVLFHASVFCIPAAADENPSQIALAIKATFLYKFAPFVDWPPTVFDAPNSPFNLCVVGEDPFRDILVNAAAGQRIGDHPVVLRYMSSVDAQTSCHVMFLAGPAQFVSDTLKARQGTPTLTVTDAAGDSPSGIIQFVIVDDRVSFVIDVTAAAKNHLTINSKLLSLAHAVRTGAAP